MQKEREKITFDKKYQLRQSSNKEILEILSAFVEECPDLRFWQIMSIFGYETNPDRFYEESYDTLQQIKETLQKKKNND